MNRGLLCSSMSLHSCAFSDCDWAGYVNDRCFTIRICIFLHSSLISWKGKKQIVVSCSSAKAEYRALASSTVEIVWLQWVTIDMGIHLTQTTLLCYDQKSALQIADNNVFIWAYQTFWNWLSFCTSTSSHWHNSVDFYSFYRSACWFVHQKSLTHLSDSTLLLTIFQCFPFCDTRLREGGWVVRDYYLRREVGNTFSYFAWISVTLGLTLLYVF